jgi:hypothetical protein
MSAFDSRPANDLNLILAISRLSGYVQLIDENLYSAYVV